MGAMTSLFTHQKGCSTNAAWFMPGHATSNHMENKLRAWTLNVRLRIARTSSAAESVCPACKLHGLQEEGLRTNEFASDLAQQDLSATEKENGHPEVSIFIQTGVPTGNRTPAAAVKGQCSNR